MAKIAVIGSGVSGLVSAWVLSQKHQVTLYEQNDYIGGHTNTRKAIFGDKTVQADTGFMVFNHQTYPNMLRMFEHLGIETMKTNMSFGVSSDDGNFEFSTEKAFPSLKYFFSLSHYKLVLDIVRFNRTAETVAAKLPENATVLDLLKEMNLEGAFAEKYLLPLSGAIWSTEKQNMLEYPAKRFVTFFNNHGLLYLKTLNPLRRTAGRLQWYTVKGGATTYVRKLRKIMNVRVKENCQVTQVLRINSKVEIADKTGRTETYDQVVFASHPDQTLSILGDASDEEQTALGAFSYSKNDVYMHKDTSFMLKEVKDWPSWTYTEAANNTVEISYYMNRLQSIEKNMPVIVTLNPSRPIATEDVFYKTVYEHPLFSIETTTAQDKIAAIQGANNTHFAGAWLGHGFHEDGIVSALAIGTSFNIAAPWEKEV